ncbi:MAG: 50S ribosomal protein L25/general stress protein Ctc [Burkholderiales bacterium]|nr:50S ribosomal protein L25/general stress protein Ctc [Burkholderiales bacterium]
MEISATARKLQGTGASRRLRIAGRVPGIVYGGDKAAQAIEMDHNTIFHQLKREVFHSSILNLVIEGEKEPVLLRDVQMHPFRSLVLHVDFQRVAKDQKVHMKVPLHFINADIAPGVKLSAGIVSHVMNEIEVSCLPDKLPEFIEVDLSSLALGHSLHTSDLKLPEGVEVIAHGDDSVVAAITLPRGAVSEEAAPPA